MHSLTYIYTATRHIIRFSLDIYALFHFDISNSNIDVGNRHTHQLKHIFQTDTF